MFHLQVLSLQDAEALIAAGRLHAEKIGVPVNLAVADPAGHLIAHVRMDEAPVPSIEHAINKAFTAALFRKPTIELKADAEPSGELFGLNLTLDRRVIVFGGGVPVLVDGAVVGAVGVSGGTADQDQTIAAAMLAAFAKT